MRLRHETPWQGLYNPARESNPPSYPDLDDSRPYYYQLGDGDIYARYDGGDNVWASIGGVWFEMTPARQARLARRLSGPFCYWRELEGDEADDADFELEISAKRWRKEKYG